MATVTRENIGTLNDKLTVQVSKDDYLPNFEKAVKQLSKNANMPGFRKGMVPASLIKKMHGQAVFADEVIKSVEKELGEYINNEKLQIFAQPLAVEDNNPNIDMQQPQEYAFAFEIGIKPEITKTPLDEKPTLTKYKVKVTDEMVNEEVERMQVKGGEMSEPETITSEDDVLNVEFEECDKEGNLIEDGISRDNSLMVKYFSPDIQKELMGKKKDDSIVFQLKGSFDEERLEAILQDLELDKDDPAAAEKYFKLTITKIGKIEKRELTEDFFKEIYPGEEVKTEEEFRNKLRDEIQSYWDSQSRNDLHNQLFELLVHDTPIDLPKEFLIKWIQTGGEKPKTAEEAEKEYPQFDHQLRWTLISEKLTKDNDISVSAEELKEGAKQKLLSYYGASGIANAEWLEPYLDKLLQDQKFLEQNYHELLTAKIFEWAEGNVNTDEKEVSVDEFSKLQEEDKHHHHE